MGLKKVVDSGCVGEKKKDVLQRSSSFGGAYKGLHWMLAMAESKPSGRVCQTLCSPAPLRQRGSLVQVASLCWGFRVSALSPSLGADFGVCSCSETFCSSLVCSRSVLPGRTLIFGVHEGQVRMQEIDDNLRVELALESVVDDQTPCLGSPVAEEAVDIEAPLASDGNEGSVGWDAVASKVLLLEDGGCASIRGRLVTLYRPSALEPRNLVIIHRGKGLEKESDSTVGRLGT